MSIQIGGTVVIDDSRALQNITNLAVVQSLPVTTVSTTSQTAAAGNHYVLTNVAATTVTLPAGASGSEVVITTTGTLITNVITPSGAETIMETAGSMTIDKANVTVTLRYLNGSWRII